MGGNKHFGDGFVKLNGRKTGKRRLGNRQTAKQSEHNENESIPLVARGDIRAWAECPNNRRGGRFQVRP